MSFYLFFLGCFLTEEPSVRILKIDELRREMGIAVTGDDVPRPVFSFSDCGFPSPIAENLASLGWTEPSVAQMQVAHLLCTSRLEDPSMSSIDAFFSFIPLYVTVALSFTFRCLPALSLKLSRVHFSAFYLVV